MLYVSQKESLWQCTEKGNVFPGTLAFMQWPKALQTEWAALGGHRPNKHTWLLTLRPHGPWRAKNRPLPHSLNSKWLSTRIPDILNKKSGSYTVWAARNRLQGKRLIVNTERHMLSTPNHTAFTRETGQRETGKRAREDCSLLTHSLNPRQLLVTNCSDHTIRHKDPAYHRARGGVSVAVLFHFLPIPNLTPVSADTLPGAVLSSQPVSLCF